MKEMQESFYRRNIRKKKFYSWGMKCIITTETLIYMDKLRSKFSILQIGNTAIQGNFFAEITVLLSPPFVFIKKKNFDTYEDKWQWCKSISHQLTSKPKLYERLRKKEKNSPTLFKTQTEKVNKFFKSNEDYINSDTFKKFRTYNELPSKQNLLQGRYNVLCPRRIYSFDTTKIADHFYATIIIDIATREIIGFICTQDKGDPGSSILKKLFDKNIINIPERFEKCMIIHGDSTGSNMSLSLKAYLTEKGINLSHTTQVHENLVSESINAVLKHYINLYIFINLDESTNLEDLTVEMQSEFVKNLITLYHLVIVDQSNVGNGYSRAFLGASLELIDSIGSSFTTGQCRYATRSSEEGKFIEIWRRMVLHAFSICNTQNYLYETYNLLVPFITQTEIIEMAKIGVNFDFEKLPTILSKTKSSLSRVKNIVKFIKTLVEEGKTKTQIKDEVESWTHKKLEKHKPTMEEKRMRSWWRKEKDENDITFPQLINQFQELNKLIVRLKDKYNYLDEILLKPSDIMNKVIDKLNLKKRSIRTTHKYNQTVGFMPEWFPQVFPTLNKICKQKFTQSKYRVGHIILKITGIKYIDLKYLNIRLLEKLFNGEDIFIKKFKKGNEDGEIYIPWVPAMEKYLALVQKDFVYLKKCVEERNVNIFEIDYNSTKLEEQHRSEIWGHLDNFSLIREISKQLRQIGIDLNPPVHLNFHSYRKGFALLIGKIFSKDEAKSILTNSLTPPINEDLKFSLKTILQTILAVENSKKFNYKNPELTEADFPFIWEEEYTEGTIPYNFYRKRYKKEKKK